MLKSIALGALLSVSAVAAQAASVSVDLQKPVARADTFIAGGVTFDCSGASCRTSEVHNDTWSVDTCRELAKQVGPVAGFSGVKGDFDAARLAKCNAGLPGGVAQAATVPSPR